MCYEVNGTSSYEDKIPEREYVLRKGSRAVECL